MILRKYQTGDTLKITNRPIGTPLAYKPVLTQSEINYINENKPSDIFIGNAGECAGDACKDLSLATEFAGVPNMYGLMNKYEREGKFSTIPREYYKEGINSSWNSAAMATLMGANIKYNSNYDKPEKLDSTLKNLPVGSVILLGTDNVLAQRNPDGYSRKFGFKPSNHTVMVYGYDEKGNPLIIDGYDQQIYSVDKLKQRWQKYNIETVYTPKEYEHLNKNFLSNIYANAVDENTKFDLNGNEVENKGKVFYNSGKYFNKLVESKVYFDKNSMAQFMHALSVHAPEIAKDLHLNSDDYTKLANLAVSIAMNETKGGKSLDGYWEKVAESHGNSRGLTQLKYEETFSPVVKKILGSKYGIASHYDFDSPEKSAIGTMYKLGELLNEATHAYKKGVDKKTFIPERTRGVGEVLKRKARGNDADWTVESRTTKGNSPLSIEQQLLYGWGGLKRLSIGDAQGNALNVKKPYSIYKGIEAFDKKPKLIKKKK
jgi:hypothetical protein